MNEKLAIKLKITDRYYPLRVDWNEEEKLREAAKRINEVVNKYKERYADKDNQDLLAMATLQFVSKLIEFEQQNSGKGLQQDIDALNNEIVSLLEKHR